MSYTPDLVVKQIVTTALARLQLRPQPLDRIFADVSSEKRTQIKAYFTRAEGIPVRLGWTQTANVAPCIAVVVPSENEAEQYLGLSAGDQWGDDGIPDAYETAIADGLLSEYQAAQFAGSVDLAIYAINADETTYIAAVLKWILLRYRNALEESGLSEQRISITDFMPAHDYPQPDAAFTRVVKLSYTSIVEVVIDDPDEDVQSTIRAVTAYDTTDEDSLL